MDQHGEPIDLPVGKPLALLAYLALDPTPAFRATLRGLLWPSLPREKAQSSLRNALSRLRKALGEKELFETTDPLVLRTGLLVSDAGELNQLLAEGLVEQAWELWDGPPLDGIEIQGAPAWAEWVEELRRDYRGRVGGALRLEALGASSAGDLRAALTSAQRSLEIDAFNPDSWVTLLDALIDIGDAREAARTLASARHNFEEESFAFERYAARLRDLHSAATEEAPSQPAPSAFVGRQRELQGLVGLWRACRQGTRQLAVIAGPTGIGKTRLVGELLKGTGVGHQSTVVSVQAVEGERTLGNALAAELARELLRLPGGAAISEASDQALRSLLPSTVRPGRGRVAGESSVPGVAMADAMADLCAAISDEGPLVVFVDDYQWADPRSRKLLGRVIRSVAETRCLFLIAFRLEEASAAARRDLSSLVGAVDAYMPTLEPLTLANVAELIQPPDRQAAEVHPDSVATRLHAATGGNPLFLIELLKSLRDDEIVEVREDRWHVRRDRLPDELVLPVSVRAVIEQRLRRLTEDALVVARHLASASGRLRPEELPRRTGLSSRACQRGLSELLDRGIIRYRDEEHLQFDHDEIRSVLSQSFPDLGLHSRWWHQPLVRWGVLPASAAALVLGAFAIGWGPFSGDGDDSPIPFGGGTLLLRFADSLVALQPPRSGADEWVAGPPEFSYPANARAVGPFRTTEGDLRWYLSVPTDRGPDIYALAPNALGGFDSAAVVTQPGDDVMGSTSPDGRHIVFTSGDTATSSFSRDLLIGNADGSDPRVLLEGQPDLKVHPWSPDGRRIGVDVRGQQDTLRIMTPWGHVVRSFPFAEIGSFDWCGSGDRVAVQGRDLLDSPPRIVVLDVEGDSVQRLSGVARGGIACSPDGSALAYVTNLEGHLRAVIHDIRTDTLAVLPLPVDESYRNPSWLPDSIPPVPTELAIAGLAGPVDLGDRVELQAWFRFSDDSNRRGPVEWRTHDPSIASILPGGRLSANRAGTTMLIASYEDWLVDSVEVEVTGARAVGAVMADNFEHIDSVRWMTRGDFPPVPSVVDGAGALRFRGSETGTHGLIERDGRPLPGGGTVEFEFKIRPTRDVFQDVTVCLSNADSPEAAWERPAQNGCLRYPGHQLAKYDPSLVRLEMETAWHTYVQLPDQLPSDDWVHGAVQLRSDGQVSLVINRRVVAISEPQLRNDPGAASERPGHGLARSGRRRCRGDGGVPTRARAVGGGAARGGANGAAALRQALNSHFAKWSAVAWYRHAHLHPRGTGTAALPCRSPRLQVLPRRLALQEGGRVDVFVHVGPVNPPAAANDLPVRSLRWSGVGESGIPLDRHADGAPVFEVDADLCVGDSDIPHAMSRLKIRRIHAIPPTEDPLGF
jgi:DNA-binding SARP family transcriptional activator